MCTTVNKLFNITALLVVVITTSSGFAQKKNAVTYQVGLLNYFYDSDPIIMNTREFHNVTGIRHFTNYVLSRSQSISYNRMLTKNSSVGINAGFFLTEYIKKSNGAYEQLPVVSIRRWHFVALEYNRVALSKTNFRLSYGGGMAYRKGIEIYHLASPKIIGLNGNFRYESVSDRIHKSQAGLTANINLKYTFWKSFFFFSKIDTQYFLYSTKKEQQSFAALKERYDFLEIPSTSKVNHTFTIGIGVEF